MGNHANAYVAAIFINSTQGINNATRIISSADRIGQKSWVRK